LANETDIFIRSLLIVAASYKLTYIRARPHTEAPEFYARTRTDTVADTDTETQRHRDTETQTKIETQRHRDTEDLSLSLSLSLYIYTHTHTHTPHTPGLPNLNRAEDDTQDPDLGWLQLEGSFKT